MQPRGTFTDKRGTRWDLTCLDTPNGGFEILAHKEHAGHLRVAGWYQAIPIGEHAEPKVAVVSDYENRGLGRQLLKTGLAEQERRELPVQGEVAELNPHWRDVVEEYFDVQPDGTF